MVFQIRGIDSRWLDTSNLLENGEPVEVCVEDEGATPCVAKVDSNRAAIDGGGCYDIDALEAEDKVVYKTDSFCFRALAK